MRWIVLGLLVTVTMVNYLDRLLLSVLSPVLRDYFHFNESLYGNITGAFQIAYAFGFLALGKFVDRVGTKIGLGVAAAVWSAASLLHAARRIGTGRKRELSGLQQSHIGMVSAGRTRIGHGHLQLRCKCGIRDRSAAFHCALHALRLARLLFSGVLDGISLASRLE
jgi:hypothetical protein